MRLFNPPVTNYTFYSYWYLANSSSAKLTFGFVNNQDSWLLDDITVYNGSQNIIINGDFESGTLNYWNYSYAGTYNTTDFGEVTNATPSWDPYKRPHTGNYYYRDGVWDTGSYISQTFATVPEHFYKISFWLFTYPMGNSTHIVDANVSITP